jgi:hypothetical protein
MECFLSEARLRLPEYRYHIVNTVEHVGANGLMQRFTSVSVITKSDSTTYHDSYDSEWILTEAGEAYICKDENGECLVDQDYSHETLPLEPLDVFYICVNDKDLRLGLAVAELTKFLVERELGLDLSNVRIINCA